MNTKTLFTQINEFEYIKFKTILTIWQQLRLLVITGGLKCEQKTRITLNQFTSEKIINHLLYVNIRINEHRVNNL